MSDSPQYEAFRAFARAEIRAQRLEFKAEIAKELRAEFKLLEGPPGKDGANGTNGVDGRDGRDGADGKPGERGTDGIATPEDLKQLAERVYADLQVRTFADVWQGTYKNGELYQRGLLTTWGGSLWLSMAETRSRPGETPDWKLVVKK